MVGLKVFVIKKGEEVNKVSDICKNEEKRDEKCCKSRTLLFKDICPMISVMCTINGIHLFTTDKDGIFKLSKWKMFNQLFNFTWLVALIIYQFYALASQSKNFWIELTSLPYIFGLFYSASFLVSMFRNKENLHQYLNNISHMTIYSDVKLRILLGLFFLFSVITSIFFILVFGSLTVRSILFIEVCLLLPNIYDFYAIKLAMPLIHASYLLNIKIQERNIITNEFLTEVEETWIHVKQLHMLYEKIFGKAFGIRIFLFVIQLMCIFYMTTMFYWTWYCMLVITPAFLTSIDLSTRLLVLSIFGNNFVDVHENLLLTITEKSSKILDPTLKASMRNFGQLISVQPCVIRIWGLGW
ncbi:UNVERIFIED_CONTAM: hypothetical protein RMT77_009567 [Armadillidium vulgare]